MRRRMMRGSAPLQTPPPLTLPARGSAELGTTAYSIPAGAKYVSPSGSNANDGNTSSTPYQTITYAIAQTNSGGTIVVRAGTYREVVSTMTSAKTLTIQCYPGEAVWIDGSVLKTGWSSVGTNVWSAPYTPIPIFTADAGTDPYRGYPDQCWINNVAQSQIADNTTPSTGQFSVNRTTSTMTIYSTTDPNTKTIEVSDKEYCHVNGPTTLRGLGYRRFSPRDQGFPASTIYWGGSSNGSVIENCIIESSTVFGIGINKPDIIMRNCTVQDINHLGVNVYQGDNFLMENCIVRRCNRGLFNPEPQTSGVKLVWTDNAILRNNLIEDCPRGYGLWTDTLCANVTMVWNEVDGTSTYGPAMSSCIEIECSDGVRGDTWGVVGTQHYQIVAGNKTWGATAGGIKVLSGGYIKIWNNDFRGNGVPVYLQQDARNNSSTMRWTYDQSRMETTNIEVVNNMLPTQGVSWQNQFIAYDDGGYWNNLGIEMVSLLDGNWFDVAPPGSMVQLGKLGGARNTYNDLTSLAAAGADVGGPWGAKLGTNYRSATKPADSGAVALPSDVAAALGIPAGMTVIGPPPAA